MKRTHLVLMALFLAIGAFAFIAIACGDDDDGDDGEPAATVVEPTDEAPTAGSHSQILADVQARGSLVCGVNDSVPGFGFVDPDGAFSGFDVDFCHAIAAAVLGDPDAVDFVPLTAQARLTALQTGQIDVLIRNTTWTLSRDVSSGLSYAITTFYDGQGMMVRTADGFTSVDDLADAEICVLQGTTTEQNLADRLPGSTGVGFEDNETLQAAFIEERCDGWTSDKSQLASRRSAFPESAGGPDSLVILAETFSKEPLGPLTIDNDDQWFDIVNWISIGLILAEEKGITSANMADFVADPGDAETARLLGVSFEGGDIFDSGLGIDSDFMQAVIAAVGNYGEIYDRNVAPIGIVREGTENALAADGGLLFSPPWK
ncbi:MAG: amino acid ABC transporter substrate-binding protein [Chloroflexi bacterium]|nr:amino acid ABC transporter substrate-binding protein [Chloroflexota bacterium]